MATKGIKSGSHRRDPADVVASESGPLLLVIRPRSLLGCERVGQSSIGDLGVELQRRPSCFSSRLPGCVEECSGGRSQQTPFGTPF
jgi:hypothetical protein